LTFSRNVQVDVEPLLAIGARIIAMAKQHGVTVLLVEPPMPASVEAEPHIRAPQAQFRWLAGEQVVPFTQGAENFPTDDPGLFADSNRLSGDLHAAIRSNPQWLAAFLRCRSGSTPTMAFQSRLIAGSSKYIDAAET
jgi:hypothetical protein